tara:strand:- start:2366 stop:2668 length:303 start_codon:yes stop_codon:yes gene_type:complete
MPTCGGCNGGRDGRNGLNEPLTTTERLASLVTVLQFDFVVALIGFFLVRYLAPQSILGRDTDVKSGLVFAFFYALFGVIRSLLLGWKTGVDEKYHSYYER